MSRRYGIKQQEFLFFEKFYFLDHKKKFNDMRNVLQAEGMKFVTKQAVQNVLGGKGKK